VRRASISIRAIPALARVGLAEAVAYRAEFLIWILSTTMPLIMLALWSAVARDAPVGRFGEREFATYFLATFIVRQLTASWAAWQLNFEIRGGTLALRLLRPVSTMLTFAISNLAAQPLRVVVALPVAIVWLAVTGPARLPSDPVLWMAFVASVAGGWLLTFFVNFAIGSLAFRLESAIRIMDVWLALYFVLSGYTIPIELFPGWVRGVANVLPFRYQIGLPVEIMTGAHDRAAALAHLGLQWVWVAAAFGLALTLWRSGLKRFAAYGG
jgi:ABC-2 type transport system permease protein